MIEVGESTGALPAMLNSVAEFFEEDVNTRMTATLSLIEPAIMIVMGSFVAFVLIALYLPIFSLADTIVVHEKGPDFRMAGDAWRRAIESGLTDPAAEVEQAQAMAARYRCEYVDLREAVDRPRPVPVHPRGPDVPLQLRAHAGAERDARNRALRPAQPEPDRRADAAAEQETARQGGHALADRRAAEEDRAIAARAGRSHRRLRAGRGGGGRRLRTRRSPSTS